MREFGRSDHLAVRFCCCDNISRHHWAIMVIVSDDVFYLGDNPVVLQRTGNPKDGSNLGFDVKGVEAFLPLSPKCALYMPCRSVSDERIAQYRNAVMLHRAVRSAVMRGYHGGAAELQAAQTTILRTHSSMRLSPRAHQWSPQNPMSRTLIICSVVGRTRPSILAARTLPSRNVCFARTQSIAACHVHPFCKWARYWFLTTRDIIEVPLSRGMPEKRRESDFSSS